MSHRKISAALSSRLGSLPAAPPIAYENAKYTPVEGTTWLRESYLPATSSTVGMEPGGSTDFIGVYQVSIYAPLDDYKFESHQLIDSITAHFDTRDDACIRGAECSGRASERSARIGFRRLVVNAG